MIIIGVDPGYAIVGYGVIEKDSRGVCHPIDYGVITTPKTLTMPQRLVIIDKKFKTLIEKYKPDHIAIEQIFFNQNTTTAIPVAEARGVLLCAGEQACGSIFEYTPLQIKQAITGNGRAEKHQVQYMTVAILKLKSIPKPDDAADALAVALCHAQTNQKLVSR